MALRQTDFGIKLVSVAGGTLKVKDELKCAFDIVRGAQNGDAMKSSMCLAIPGQIVELLPGLLPLAIVEVPASAGASTSDSSRTTAAAGDWVLIHVGFAMSKISEERRARADALLADARRRRRGRWRRCAGYGLGTDDDARGPHEIRRRVPRPRADSPGRPTRSAAWPIRRATTASWKCAAATRTPSTASASRTCCRTTSS